MIHAFEYFIVGLTKETLDILAQAILILAVAYVLGKLVE